MTCSLPGYPQRIQTLSDRFPDFPAESIEADDEFWDLQSGHFTGDGLRGFPSRPEYSQLEPGPWYFEPIMIAPATEMQYRRLVDDGLELLRNGHLRTDGGREIPGLAEYCSPYTGIPLHHILDRDPGDDLSFEFNPDAAYNATVEELLGGWKRPFYLRWTDPALRAVIREADESDFPFIYAINPTHALSLAIAALPDDVTRLVILANRPLTTSYTELTVDQYRAAHAERAAVAAANPRPQRPRPRPRTAT